MGSPQPSGSPETMGPQPVIAAHLVQLGLEVVLRLTCGLLGVTPGPVWSIWG